MIKKNNIFLMLLSVGIFSLSLSGCDLIKEKFSKGEEKEAGGEKISRKETKNTGPLTPDTLARIGSWTISKEEFGERLKVLKEVLPEYDISNPQARSLVLEEIVRQQLFVIEAEKKGIAKEKEIVQAVEDFRRNLIVRKLAAELVENITISDQEAEEFYEKNKENLVEPPGYHLREIVVETQSEANEIVAKLLGGADFEATARDVSISASADSGGDIGFIRQIPFPEMAAVVSALSEGEISEVVKGPDGYYIVKLEEKSKERALSLEEIKEDLKANLLLSKQQEAIINHINQLKQQFKVEINEEALK